MGADRSPFAVVVALDGVVAAQEAGLVGKIVQPLLEHRVVAHVGHHRRRFLAEHVAHDHPHVAGAHWNRQVLHRERTGLDRRGIGLGVVDVDVHRRGHHGGTADVRRRVGDQQRRRAEIALVLQSAHAHRRAIAPGARDRVARHGAGDALRIVAAKRGVEPDRAVIVVAAEEAGGKQPRPGKRADLPVGAERRDVLGAVVTQVVVEEAAACVGHRKAVIHRQRRSGAAKQLRRKVERERELCQIQPVVEPDALHAEPARPGKAQQVQPLGREAPFLELGLADIERAAGGKEAHRNRFKLLAVHDRLNQQRALRWLRALRRLGIPAFARARQWAVRRRRPPPGLRRSHAGSARDVGREAAPVGDDPQLEGPVSLDRQGIGPRQRVAGEHVGCRGNPQQLARFGRT